MTENEEAIKEIKAFWNRRADLGLKAGTGDTIAKKLEMEAISSYIRDGMYILDVGCGNGITAVELTRRFNARVVGVDFAESMIEAARRLVANENLKGSLEFRIHDVRNLSDFSEKFDLVYTERTLINLPDWLTQGQVIKGIGNLLVEGGLYVMCENSQDGVDKINSLRRHLGLSEIVSPWHNRYLRDAEIKQLTVPGMRLEDIIDFSSTYYFLSRVVNAWLAAQEGKEPDYESLVNELGLKLPSIGNMGQVKIWLWRKVGGDSER